MRDQRAVFAACPIHHEDGVRYSNASLMAGDQSTKHRSINEIENLDRIGRLEIGLCIEHRLSLDFRRE